MKKLLYFLISTCLFISCSSSDNDEDYAIYSEKQKNALAVMNGTFEDITFGLANEDHYKIIFGTQYRNTLDINKTGGDILIKAQGECIWHSRGAGNDGRDIPCYYEVSVDATYFTLVYKGGENDKQLFERLELKSISQNNITLKDKILSLPYSFVRKN